MNLVTDPWIPIIFNDGSSNLVSLHDAFALGHKIRDLNVMPHERIALMRLLVCIAQAGLDGPNTYEEWQKSFNLLTDASVIYLRKWQDSFELFGAEKRFLQITGLSVDRGKDADNEQTRTSKLDLALATGANTTLFDNSATKESRDFSNARLALMLLSFQCFSPGGRIGIARWNGVKTLGGGASSHAPCTGSVIHTLIHGETLTRTTYLNLISKEECHNTYGETSWGKPIWEQMPSSPHDASVIRNITKTYLGRLLPLSRAIWLLNHRYIILANGFLYPPYPTFREATTTAYIHKSKKTASLLKVSSHKATWRELHSILVISKDRMGGPLSLSKLDGKHDTDLWTGALVIDPGKAAKILDTVESSFHIPANMFTEFGRKIYEEGVIYANQSANALERSISIYLNKMIKVDPDRAKMKFDSDRAKQIKAKSALHFWTSVQNGVSLLLDLVKDPSPLGMGYHFHSSKWGHFIQENVKAAYTLGCPHSTSRQIEAFAAGENELSIQICFKKQERNEQTK